MYVQSNSTLIGARVFRCIALACNWDSEKKHPFYVDAGYTIDARFMDIANGDSRNVATFAFKEVIGYYLPKSCNRLKCHFQVKEKDIPSKRPIFKLAEYRLHNSSENSHS